MNSKPSINDQHQELLQKAQEYANQGAGLKMLECLFDSMLLEAFLNHFSGRYPDLRREEIYDIIGKATDEIVARISQKNKIKHLSNYLWKSINNQLSRAVVKAEITLSIEQDEIEIRERPALTEAQQNQRDEARGRAIALAESLIPRLGQQNVQTVMKYILGALKNGAQDVPNIEIADALGMTPGNVRVSVSRGFSRLARIVKEEGLIETEYDFPFLEEHGDYLNETERNSDL